MLTDELIASAESGDIETLVLLDANGFLIAPKENCADFAARLKKLQTNLVDLDSQIEKNNLYTIEGMKFAGDGLIPKKDFAASCKQTEELFGFSIDWVPGFYQNPSFGWLFGGCCYTSEPDFFSFFQIRETFKKKSHWLFYNRNELMAHELCHVARSGIDAKYFEEFFAYKTSEKQFRKVCGSVLYSQVDTFLILIGSLSLPIAQYLNLSGVIANLPLWPFATFLALVIANLVRRYFFLENRYNSALINLEPLFGNKSAAVLFRCSDAEIKDFSKASTDSVTIKIEKLVIDSLRWQIITKRFGVDNESIES